MVLRVGVVVPCKNEAGTIERCLTALRQQDPRPDRIVVVDNGSIDGSLEIARSLADEVLQVPAGRIGDLRNRGAEAAGDVDVLAFVDADCEVSAGWTAAALEALEDADLVGSRSLAASDATWVAGRWAAIEARQAHDGSYVWSQHLAIRAEMFDKLDGFDAGLPTAEDIDLSRRVIESGGTVRFVPGMIAVHHGFPSTLSTFVRRERWHTRAPGWFARMSGKSRGLVLLSAAWAVVGALAGARAAATRNPAPAGAWAAASVAGLPVLGVLAGRSPRHAAQDGVLLGLWAGIRAVRLPREAVSRAGGADT